MSDRLDTIKAALDVHESHDCDCSDEELRNLRWLVADVEQARAEAARLEAQLADLSDSFIKLGRVSAGNRERANTAEADLAALRQRHAEAASRTCSTCAAWDGPDADDLGWCKVLEQEHRDDFFCAAWLASEAKKGLG